MADATAPVLSLRMHPMPLLAHLEELRKRIIFSVLGVLAGFLSCWSFADRIFGLMQQPIINALRHHGLGGGLVYLNPTDLSISISKWLWLPACSQLLRLCFINRGCSSLPACIAQRNVMCFLSYSAPAGCSSLEDFSATRWSTLHRSTF
jgi:hypothetical protein